MGNRYVNVTITRQTKAVSQKGFGLPLILSTDKKLDYKEYTEIDGIGTDYGTNSATYKLASALLGQTPRPEKIAIYGVAYVAATGNPTDLSTALNELVKKYNDFFYLHCSLQSDPVITELSKWINTQEKFYFASTVNKNLAKTLNSQNTVIMVHPSPDTYPAAAWVGVCAPQQVGSYTWTFKNLNGIAPANYDLTVINDIEANNASTYITEGGVNITSKGITASGEYIDILQGQYFLKARMTEAVFGLLARLPKVPFTDAGIALVVAEMEKTLKAGVNQGIIARDKDENPLYSIAAPTRAEVSTNDRAQRILPDLEWEAEIAGAIENAKIRGVLKI
ncbi:DUF3383 family protein [Bacillus cereus]|jgi:hypothetical protein|uniref:DUF3383 family protein n=1 Tax=Bacillus cereus TaxID=1396 RepID=UPI001926709B|nr:DUF3383 family protein [Bacillus cereus]MBL3768818.1 DUF3383 family protein [Bacillus cereus]HDR4393016.1 DUF3383 family protein [Bacillus cereus]